MSETRYGKPELGAASILIDLSHSTITVYHGTDKLVLARKDRAVDGDWDRIWAALESIGLERVS